jgi:acyl-coenzyme A synthetase/AMP-(fatty) acid ligase
MSNFTKITICPKIVVGVLNTHWQEHLLDQSCAVPYGQTYGQTDMIALIVIFSNCFAKPPKNAYKNFPEYDPNTSDGTYTP